MQVLLFFLIQRALLPTRNLPNARTPDVHCIIRRAAAGNCEIRAAHHPYCECSAVAHFTVIPTRRQLGDEASFK